MSKSTLVNEIAHDIAPGDIFYNSWGWEQTNIDFYQIIAATKKTVKIQQVNQTRNYNASSMTGKTSAIPNDFISDETLRKKPYFWSGEWRLNFEHGSGCRWDGDELTYTCYA
jgi:hypothetical protein